MTNDEPNAPTDERSNDLEVTLCPDGRHINVRNPRSGSGEIHTVTLSDSGEVNGCTCPGSTYHGHCYHVDTVRSSPILLSSARACSGRQVATDGGHTPDTQCEDCGHYFAVHDDPTCPECGGHGSPVRSEAPDMGGGESTGVVDLE